jgi:hypothetical protein
LFQYFAYSIRSTGPTPSKGDTAKEGEEWGVIEGREGKRMSRPKGREVLTEKMAHKG